MKKARSDGRLLNVGEVDFGHPGILKVQRFHHHVVIGEVEGEIHGKVSRHDHNAEDLVLRFSRQQGVESDGTAQEDLDVNHGKIVIVLQDPHQG